MKLTIDNAIAAIDDFEIVGDNNLSRDPTPEERFVLREFVARLFEDATPEISFSLTKDARRSLATKAASDAARIPGSTLYNAAELAIEEACNAFTARAASAGETVDERSALSEDRIDWIANAHCPSGTAYPANVKNAIREALRESRAASASETGAEGANDVTLDRRDLFDFARGAIKSALEDYKAGEGMAPCWYWQEATNRAEALLEALDTKSPYIGSPAMAAEAVASEPFAWIRANVPEHLASPIAYSASTELLKKQKDGYLPVYLAPQPAQADAREGMTEEQIKAVAEDHWSSCRYVDDECIYEFDRNDLTGFARALLAAHPGQPEPRAEVTDDQIAAMFERVTGYSIENGRAALNDADILGFARELLEAARTGASS